MNHVLATVAPTGKKLAALNCCCIFLTTAEQGVKMKFAVISYWIFRVVFISKIITDFTTILLDTRVKQEPMTEGISKAFDHILVQVIIYANTMDQKFAAVLSTI